MENITKGWEVIKSYLSNKSVELETWGHYRSSKQQFFARLNKDRIIITGKSFNGHREISFKEFECVAKHYDDYIQGVKGTRKTIRDNCGYNSSYIITLIHEFCDMMNAAEQIRNLRKLSDKNWSGSAEIRKHRDIPR
jgi:hypothetical protein